MPNFNLGNIGSLFQKLPAAVAKEVDYFAKTSLKTVPRGIRSAATQYYDPSRIVSSAKPLMNPRLATYAEAALASLGVVGRVANPLLSAAAVADQAQVVFNPSNNIFTAIQNVGTSIQNINKPFAKQNEYVGTDPFALKRNEQIRAAKFNANLRAKNFNPQLAGEEGIWGRYAPADYRYQYTLDEDTAPPGSVPPAPNPNSNLSSGLQAGQLTTPPPSLINRGVVSNGAGVPAQRENVLNRSLSQEVLNAAQQYAAPTNVPLSAFYEGQQQLGRRMMQKGNLVSELQRLGAAPGMAPENLKAWAQANPDLAYREFLRLKQM